MLTRNQIDVVDLADFLEFQIPFRKLFRSQRKAGAFVRDVLNQ
jgi:hypothetical protein